MNSTSAMALLANPDCTITQLTQAVNFLEKINSTPTVKIGVSSSVTVDLLGIYLRKHGVLHNTKIEVVSGNYDDPIGDVEMFTQAGITQMVLLPFFDNVLPSFEAQLKNLSTAEIDAKEFEIRQRYRLAFSKAHNMHTVYLGSFHQIATASDTVASVLDRFNTVLREEASVYSNIQFINTEDIISTIGQTTAFDYRFYFRSKSPYSSTYMDKLAQRVAELSRGFGTYFYKVLALDCDNTLWGGVVGEDLIDGIKLDPHDYPGNVFWRMQHEFVALQKQGVLLVLLSKNNQSDVDEVLDTHPNMVLQHSNIIIKKINWNDKPTNLQEVAHELNVGVDSIVFLDDSSFECELMRQQLPMVKTMQVPSVLSAYCELVDHIKSLFLAGGIAADSKEKTQQYQQLAAANQLKSQTLSQQEYLASLELNIELACNVHASVGRISELSQKTNQFNLTTRRYSAVEIEQMMASSDHAVYTLVVNDKFGSAGLTGVIIMHYDGDTACVDNFFMSCRVIGRSIESGIWHQIVEDARQRGCATMTAKFIPSSKNAQVQDFYTQLGLTQLPDASNGVQQYSVALVNFVPPTTPWMKITYVK